MTSGTRQKLDRTRMPLIPPAKEFVPANRVEILHGQRMVQRLVAQGNSATMGWLS
jgi:hypothetical protein